MDNSPPRSGWLRRTAKIIGQILVGYTALCGAAMMLLICADVFGRYFLRHPVPGTMHIVSYYFMVAFIFLPLANVQLRKEHVVTLFFTQNLPQIWKDILDLFAQILMFGMFFIAAWYTWHKALYTLSISEAIEETYRVVTWPVHFYLPIASWALCLQLIIDIADSSLAIIKRKTT
jgi:TRAP-type C4-dicarboxylate transport system permease small subunit